MLVVVFGFITLMFVGVILESKKTWHYVIPVFLIVAGVLTMFVGASKVMDWQNTLSMQSENHTTFQDIYSATVPYGIISLSGSGWKYYYSLNYAEIYSIKIMSGNEVLTYSYKTSECRVIVDGTFKLEQFEIRYFKIDPFDDSRIWCDNKGYAHSWDDSDWQSWKPIIHIPEMPTPQNTITDWYVGG